MRDTRDIKQLKQLAEPLVNLLKEKFNPYAKIEITDSHIKLVQETISIPNE